MVFKLLSRFLFSEKRFKRSESKTLIGSRHGANRGLLCRSCCRGTIVERTRVRCGPPKLVP
eukprot:scaffold770_cov255-Pinguiococcus_pyrenoidosus.AAC.44